MIFTHKGTRYMLGDHAVFIWREHSSFSFWHSGLWVEFKRYYRKNGQPTIWGLPIQ